MSRCTRPLALAAALAALVAGASLWQAVAREAKPADPSALGGAERYLAHVSTDKPLYRPGESVYVRAVVLDAHTHRPLAEGAQPQGTVEVKGPKGETVVTGLAVAVDSVLGFQWTVPEGQAGGVYKVRVTWPWDGHAPAERSFEVRAYRAPRLKNQIVFLRDGYGPGDIVAATLHTERAEGGLPAGAGVEVLARVDGAEVHRGRTTVDADGNARAEFALPAAIARGEGTLAFVIEDGGVVETATKTIPILLQTVDLRLYPEGGQLVAGLPTRVYLEAKTPAAKPADIAGVVVDASGRTVARFRTEHEGRGRFRLKPAAGAAYTLKITEPSGIATTWPLPEVRARGAVIGAVDEVTLPTAPLRLKVGASEAGRYVLTVTRMEREVARQQLAISAGLTQEISVRPKGDADGVLVATVWTADGEPLAERLLYREPPRSLQVRVAADRAKGVPGGSVELTVETTDAEGEPVPATVGLTVTDESVLELIEKREQAPRLPVMVLLESDVRELADAHVYLDPENEKAPLAVDLLLGTQGWRRFAFVDPAAFIGDHADAARRVLALRMATEREVVKATETGRFLVDDFAGAVPEFAARPMGGAVPVPAEVAPAAPEPPADVATADGVRLALEKAEDRERGRALLDRDEQMEEEPARLVVVVREYAHAARPDRKPGERRDFTETLYWGAAVRTDAATGRATVRFDLSDAVTSFRVMADAFAADGALGAGTETIESVEPFYVEPKIPLEVTSGDVVELPVSVVNGTEEALPGVSLTATAGAGLRVGECAPFDVAAGGRTRRVLQVRAGVATAPVELLLKALAGPYGDEVVRPVKVVPRGFPVARGFGGLLDAAHPAEHEVVIPAGLVANSVRTAVNVYPTPLANLTQALERLLVEPSGCFEQTTSTNYPLVMAQQYFQTHTGVDPALIARGKDLLAKGYQRLTGFECREKGYEWFGEDPGHEALTAFGLLEFEDMAQVYSVDAAMMDRTRAWLLGTRDGKGGFKRERRALHTWVGDPDASNAYILWALLEAGEPAASLEKEIAAVEDAAAKSGNAYVHALAANALALAGRMDPATKLMERLAAAQVEDGHVGGATESIVGSRGAALDIETTSLAALAWMRVPQFAGDVEESMRFIADSCQAGRYGSTQSTVLALRAIVTYDALRARPKQPGRVRVYVDDQPVGDSVPFGENTQGAIALPDVSELLTPGRHTLSLRMEDGAEMPYAMSVDYYDEVPDTSPDSRVDLTTSLAAATVEEGEITEATLTVRNKSEEAIPMVVAIVGIPGGLEPRHDRLKELVKERRIAAWEIRGRDLVLYWRTLTPSQSVDVTVPLVAAVPGAYTGPASRAYEYYGDEHKTWVKPLEIKVVAK